MNRTEIKITRPLATHLLGLAQKSPRREVCGLVGGIEASPKTVYPVSNIAADPERAFEMDAKEQIAAFKAMREKGESLFAVYHSHPDSPAEPSARDFDELGYPGAYQMIISLNTKGVLEMRAYQKDGDAMREVELRV